MNTEYKKNGYLIVRNYLSSEWADCLRFFFLKAKENKKTKPDTMSPGSHGYWGANPYELLLDFKTDFLKKLLKWDSIVPTYSYGRIYKYGATLLHHIDRPSCQLSVTVNLGGDYNHSSDRLLIVTSEGNIASTDIDKVNTQKGNVDYRLKGSNKKGRWVQFKLENMTETLDSFGLIFRRKSTK